MNVPRKWLIWMLVGQTVAAIATLNLPFLWFGPLNNVYVGIVTGLLIVGVIGSARNHRYLYWCGIIGVVLIMLALIATVIPGEDYVLTGTPGGAPNLPTGRFMLARLTLILCICGSLLALTLAIRPTQERVAEAPGLATGNSETPRDKA
jgi:hypothetical protein